MNTDKVFLFFEDCRLVKGYKRSLICDLSRQNFEFIPNSLVDVLGTNSDFLTIQELKANYNVKDQIIIEEYIDLLIKKDYGFLCDQDEVKLFPKINTEWDYPAIISNGIIDINSNTSYNITQVLIQYEELGCRNIFIRCYVQKSIIFWNNMFDGLKKSSIKSIELISVFAEEYVHDEISKFIF